MNENLISLVIFAGLDVKLGLSSEGNKLDGGCCETYC
jgi:hypothetical protein